MHFIKQLMAGVFAAALLAGGAMAQERGTREEAKAMVEAAIEHIKKAGPAKAYDDFTNDKVNWTKKDLYVVVADPKGVMLASGNNPKIVGKDLSMARDGNGKAFVPDLIALAAQGGGWYDYDFPDPVTKKLMPKSTYSKRGPSGEGFVGVGVYR